MNTTHTTDEAFARIAERMNEEAFDGDTLTVEAALESYEDAYGTLDPLDREAVAYRLAYVAAAIAEFGPVRP